MERNQLLKVNIESQELTKGFQLLQRRIKSVRTVIEFAPKIPNMEKRLLIQLLNQNLDDCQRYLNNANRHGGA